MPVFALEAQEGRLFSPLAYTKTYAMAAAAALSVTLVPVLMGYLIRGRIPAERKNPLNRLLIAAYRPLLAGVLRCAVAHARARRCCVALSMWIPLRASAASSCRRSTRATCSTCRRRFPGSRPARRRRSCSRPTG